MQALVDFWNNLDPTLRIYMPIIGISCIVAIVYSVIYMKSSKKKVAAFLAANPNAAKVYITNKKMDLTGTLSVHTVDSQLPVPFTEGMKRGFYVAPGTHIIETSYSSSRPGIFVRSVTKTYGPSKQEITVQPGAKYQLYFDAKNTEYSFEQVTE